MKKLTITLLILLSSMMAFSQETQTKVLCQFDNGNTALITVSVYTDATYITFEANEESKFTAIVSSFTEKDGLFIIKTNMDGGVMVYYFNTKTERFTINTGTDSYNGDILSREQTI